ncbi:MAG: hypothetical protein KME32_35135 [Mojavia pulchra JT2-VF2]|uniref:NB-ARC domain-containing protein n=1 Tax=Mojavia pulchra JT2-VF2 TaxID=287848 RepID=A0A951Q5N4_9NOST|nr:hypothetical protein [Mojavia pulchra JT2-VF2]
MVDQRAGNDAVQIGQIGSVGTININTHPTPAGKPFQAPPLPTYYVDRPEYSQDFKNRLLKESNDVRTLVVTAIHGLGSVGKSTLAAALAHDPEVQAHFCDGILWATLGQQPNLLSLLSSWVQALGDYNFKATSTEAASNQLRTLLYDKAVLLVVDDAWNPEDAQPFNIGGARCQVLVTTREAAIAQVLGASTYSLDVMQPSQAIELLTKKLGRNLTDTETQSAEVLAKELGYLPLALELAAAQVAGGIFWTVLVQDMQKEVARLRTVDDKAARDAADEACLKRLSLTASLNLSIQRLSKETQEKFIWLGILPEDVTITGQMVVTLWDMDDERDAADELGYLHSKALLLSGVPLVDGTPTYRLHDLFHDLARNLLTSPPTPKRRGDFQGLGITLAHAHATFVEKYRQKTQDGLWHTLPNDGYIHQHLVWHLEKAQRVEDIHQLLREESETGCNDWYKVRKHLGQIDGYLNDIDRAWKLIDASCTETILPKTIGRQFYYAFITNSFNRFASKIPPNLLVELVQQEIWSPQQSLAYAKNIPDPKQKTATILRLVAFLSQPLAEQAILLAFNAAKIIKYELDFAESLIALAPHLPESLLSEALTTARNIETEEYRVKVLIALIPHLSESLLSEALTIAKNVETAEHQLEALIALASYLPEILPEALKTARSTQLINRTKYLSYLLPYFPEILPEALNIAWNFYERNQSRGHLAVDLSTLASYCHDIVPQALNAIRNIVNEKNNKILNYEEEISNKIYVIKALKILAPHLSHSSLSEALIEVWRIRNTKYQAQGLCILVPYLPKNFLSEILKKILTLLNKEDYVQVLCVLVPHLPQDLFLEALKVVRETDNNKLYVQAVSAFYPDLSKDLQKEIFWKVRAIKDHALRVQALIKLAPHLPETLFSEALNSARAFSDEKHCKQLLIVLIPRIPKDLLLEALRLARSLTSHHKIQALCTLAPYLPTILPEVLQLVQVIRDDLEVAQAFSTLVRYSPSNILPKTLQLLQVIRDDLEVAKILSSLLPYLAEYKTETFKTIKTIKNENYRAQVLIDIISHLPQNFLPEVIKAADEFKDKYYCTQILSALVSYIPDILPKIINLLPSLPDDHYRIQILNILSPHLPNILPKALKAAEEIENKREYAKILATLTLYFTENGVAYLRDELEAGNIETLFHIEQNYLMIQQRQENLSKMLEIAKRITSARLRVQYFISISSLLPEAFLEALKTLQLISDEQNRVQSLRNLVPKLPKNLLSEALNIALRFEDKEYYTQALIALFSYLPDELLPKALQATQAIKGSFRFQGTQIIQNNSLQVQALTALIPHLPESLLLQTLQIAEEIKDYNERVQLLIALAQKLPNILPETFKAVLAIQEENERVQALSNLAPYLPETLLPEAFKAVLAIQGENERVQALIALADKLPPELLRETLAATKEIQDESSRAEVLSSLAVKLSQLPKNQLFSLWRDNLYILSLRTRRDLLSQMGTLTPVIFALGGEQAVKDTASAIQDVSRWWS